MKSLPQTYFTSNGTIEIYNPANNATLTNLGFKKDKVLGSANCAKEDPTECKVTAVGMTNDRRGNFAASFALPESIALTDEDKERAKIPDVTQLYKERQFTGARTFVSERPLNPFRRDKNAQKRQQENKAHEGKVWNWQSLDGDDRRDLQDNEDEGAAYITNPVICTTRGSALLFENLSAEKYPVYVKDSLLNTNDNFDYGEFDALSALLSSEVVKSFVFTFDEPGIYVFADSRNSAKQMVIAIMADGKACPSDTSFSPQTYASLIKIGAFRRDVLEPPAWWLFFGVLFAFCALILGAVALIAYIFKRQWKSDAVPRILYQNTNYKAVENDDFSDKNALVS